jgi:hypothetical protein
MSFGTGSSAFRPVKKLCREYRRRQKPLAGIAFPSGNSLRAGTIGTPWLIP